MAKKRRRAASSKSGYANPHHYSGETLKQLRVAGLAPTQELPRAKLRGFPHRGFDSHKTLPSSDEEDDEDEDGRGDDVNIRDGDLSAGADTGGSEGDSHGQTTPNRGKRRKGKGKRTDHYRTDRRLPPRVKMLRAIIDRSLQTGKIERAEKAWVAVLHESSKDTSFDLRDSGLWCLGAEILMRQGEEEDGYFHSREFYALAHDVSSPLPRWGRWENIQRVKNYYDTLSKAYPYGQRNRLRANALDFEESKFSCEVYNIQIEHSLGCWRLDRESGRPGISKQNRPNEHQENGESESVQPTNVSGEGEGADINWEDVEDEEEENQEDDGEGNDNGSEGNDGGDEGNIDGGEGQDMESPDLTNLEEDAYGLPIEEEDLELQAYQEQHSDGAGSPDYASSSENRGQSHRGSVPEIDYYKAYCDNRDFLNVEALEMARDIASRMDVLMLAYPFKHYPRLLRLRGILALWMADLFVPAYLIFSESPDTLESEMRELPVEGESASVGELREKELEKARQAFADIVKLGGEVEPIYRKYAEKGQEDNPDGINDEGLEKESDFHSDLGEPEFGEPQQTWRA